MLRKSLPCKITKFLKFFEKIAYFRLLLDMRLSNCLISLPLLSKCDQHSSNSIAYAISDNFGFSGGISFDSLSAFFSFSA